MNRSRFQALAQRTSDLAARIRGGLLFLRPLATRLGRRAWKATAGGRWTDRLSPPVRKNLRWFWFDGLFANAGESIVLTYLPLFLLTLGASSGQIGLMTSLASLGAALILLPGAMLVERWGHRKQIVVLAGGGVGRFTLLLMALTPLVLSGPAAIYAVIGLAVLRSVVNNAGLPAWTSLTADIVPLSWRGRYLSSRNIAMSVAGLLTSLLVGQIITLAGSDLVGHQLAMGLAFAIGLLATFSFSRIDEPPMPIVAKKKKQAHPSLIKHLRGHPEFLAFCATAALWNLSLRIAGPFFAPFQVQILGATPDVIGVLSILSPLAALPAQRLFGTLTDRWGPRRVQLIIGFLIPVLPWSWLLTRSPWHVAPIGLAGGFLWAGYNLANFNLLLTLAPEDMRPRYTALYQIVVTLAFAIGAALGSGIFELVSAAHSEVWGYHTLFIVSGVGRLIAAILFTWQGRLKAKAKGHR